MCVLPEVRAPDTDKSDATHKTSRRSRERLTTKRGSENINLPTARVGTEYCVPSRPNPLGSKTKIIVNPEFNEKAQFP